MIELPFYSVRGLLQAKAVLHWWSHVREPDSLQRINRGRVSLGVILEPSCVSITLLMAAKAVRVTQLAALLSPIWVSLSVPHG